MAHVQQQIIDWWHTTLLAGPTDAGTSVHVDRVDPFEAAELPALRIEGVDESVQTITIDAPVIQRREFEVTVAAIVEQASGYEAAARDLGLQVEKIAAAGRADAGGLCSGGVQLLGSEMAKAGEGERAVAALLQHWRCIYHVHAVTPDAVL